MPRPLPNNVEVSQWDRLWSQNDLSEYIAPHIAKNIYDVWESTAGFFREYALWILGIILFIGVLHFFYKRLQKKQQNIQKLWHFLLFFLSKRQMMIPLLCTLGKRKNVLSAQKIKRLIDLRDMSRQNSLQEHPQKRIALEEEISQLLFTFFETLDQEGQLNEKQPFYHIMKDLEYIDEKLVELQTIYNKEATQWNKRWGNGKLFFLGLKPFQAFGE